MTTSPPPSDARTYHTTQSAYILPNDAQEHHRLENTASCIRALLDSKIIHSPVNHSSIRKVIDIGCGTGATTDELASLFSEAQVYGVDLSPVPAIRPQKGNVEYIQGDILELARDKRDEKLAEGTFDYVFSRFLMGGITDWEGYIKLCLKLAKPGTWLEFQEPDMTAHPLPVSKDIHAAYPQHPLPCTLASGLSSTPPDPESWRVIWHNLMRSRGLNPRIGTHLSTYLSSAGLQDVTVKRFPLPFGTWEGMTDVQRRMAGVHEAFVRDDAPVLIRRLGAAGKMGREEVERVIGGLEEFLARFEGNGECGWVYVVCGRKAGVE